MIELPNSAEGVGEYFITKEDLERSTLGLPDQEVAIWHSHPSGLIGPSRKDMEHRPPDHIPMLVVTLTPDGPVPTWF